MEPIIREKIETFFAAYPAQKVSKNEVIIQAGSDPAGVFYLVEGAVRQYDITDRGDEVVVNVFKTPAFFPMSWAINRTPNDYFFETTESTTVRRAPADDVVKFLQANPDVTFDLLSRVYKGTDGLLRRLAHLMGGSAHSRLVFEIITECKRFGRIMEEDKYLLPLKEGEIGERAGMSRETVSRGMRELKEAGFIEVTPNGLIITSLSKLETHLGNTL